MTNIEFYVALKEHMKEEAARLIAEAVPPSADIARRSDIQELRLEIKADIKGMEASVLRWMITMFVPVWIGVFGIIITLLLG